MRILLGVAAIGLSCVSVQPVHAEVFFWRDAGTKMSVTFPDRWRQMHNQSEAGLISVVAPGVRDYAQCEVRSYKDRRYVIYPRRFDDHIQHISVSRDFWDRQLGEYDDYKVHQFHDNAGLGLGFASFAEASFTTPVGPRVEKRGLFLASIYNDKLFTFQCSSAESVFHKWKAPFLSFLKSVQFHSEFSSHPAGYYRNFLADDKIHINYGQRAEDNYLY